MDTIKDEILAIDKTRMDVIKHLEQTVQPLAQVVKRLLRDFGVIKKKAWFGNKTMEYCFKRLSIVRKGNKYSSEPIKVFYDDKLVFEFDANLIWAGKLEQRQIYLHFYNSGEWEQSIVEEYRRVMIVNLRENYDIKEIEE